MLYRMELAHRLVNTPERFIVEAIFQWDVDGISHPLALPSVFLCPGSGEVLPELMEATGHDTVCRVECFLDAVSVVAVDVDVQYPWVCSQEFENSEYDIIDVTEAGRLPFLGVMEATCPIY